MNHPIKDYWKIAFAPFQVGPDHYRCAQMPDPILSPYFLNAEQLASAAPNAQYFNLVQDAHTPVLSWPGFRIRNEFHLGRLPTRRHEIEFDYKIEPLERISENPGHLNLLREGFPQDYAFLRELEKFLPTLNATYLVGNILDEAGDPVACVTMGVAGSIGKLISGTVHTRFRNQKVSRKLKALVQQMSAESGVSEVFYWTKSNLLTGYAERVDKYLVFVRG